MKKILTRIGLCYLLFAGFAIASCGKDELSKTEAAKQIAEASNVGKKACVAGIGKNRFLITGSTIQDQCLADLANNGKEYVRFDLQSVVDVYQARAYVKDFQILDKAKPFIASGEDPELTYLRFGEHKITVGSITEAAPDMSGSVVCKVLYKDSLVLNELGKGIGMPLGDLNTGEERTAKFVKMLDGWKLDKESIKERHN